ncbi:MAG: glycoside hydrolase family 127 protein, partial [Solobacterium sp.]|nr:glycoside hydrolase family 127 protein [Solobacterium sp.]
IARTLTSLGQYIYAIDEKGIFINLLISSELQEDGITVQLNNSFIKKGQLSVNVRTDHPVLIRLRVPQWVSQTDCNVNGKSFMPETVSGYTVIPLEPGSHQINLTGRICPQILSADERVYADTGKVAVQYGPFIYCLEEIDNGKNLSAICLSPDTELYLEKGPEELPGEMPVLKTRAKRLRNQTGGRLYDVPHFKYEHFELTAVPYAVWGNREPGEMTVWIRALI